MDDDKKNQTLDVTPEEQKAEEEATKEVNTDELKSKLAEEMGLDPTEQSDLLDKLVEREKSHREKLSGAIKQKINYRTKFTEATSKPNDDSKKNQPNGQGTPDIDKLVDEKLNAVLEERDLESLNLSDEIKEEVKVFAKAKGISVRAAAQLPYIKSLVEEEARQKRVENAIPTGKKNGTYSSGYDPSKPLDPKEFDMSTDEGRKAWEKAKAARRQYKQNNK